MNKGAGSPLIVRSARGLVQDSPVDGATRNPISSNWAYDHAADLAAHTYNFGQKIRTGTLLRPFPSDGGIDTALVADRIYAVPFLVGRNLTLDRLTLDVVGAGAAGKIARLGIYNDGVNLYPGTLVKDFGTVAVDAIALVAAIATQALTKGLYFVVVVSDGTPTVRGVYPAYSPLGQIETLHHVGYFYDHWYKAAVGSGALADPFVSGATLSYQGPGCPYGRLASLN